MAIKDKVKTPKVTVAQKNEKSEAIVPTNEAEVYQLMERRDEEQIVASLEGKYLDEFVYSFQQGGKVVEGLSWVGIQEAARAYGGVQCPIEKMKVEETEKDIIVYIEAIDVQTNSSAIGVSSQSRMMRTFKGVMEDAFARQKAVAKAQRNAKKQLLPQALLRQWIEKHRIAKSGGTSGSLKVLIDEFHASWRAKGLSKEYVQQKLVERYKVSSTAQLNRDQLTEFTAWINSQQSVSEVNETFEEV